MRTETASREKYLSVYIVERTMVLEGGQEVGKREQEGVGWQVFGGYSKWVLRIAHCAVLLLRKGGVAEMKGVGLALRLL